MAFSKRPGRWIGYLDERLKLDHLLLLILMSKKDLQRFLNKVQQLQEMVISLEKFPGRRERLEACKDHDQVVNLARSWGYEIGQRWGE